MKTIVREISKDESQKWGNIARIRCIDGEFDQKVEAREKEAFEKIEKAKKDAERLMVEVNEEYKKETSSIETAYMELKMKIDKERRDKVLEIYEEWIHSHQDFNIYKRLKEVRYFISLRQYLISKWLEQGTEKSWNPFEEKKSDQELRNVFDIDQDISFDDKIAPLRDKLYVALGFILLGKDISRQSNSELRELLTSNEDIQLTAEIKDFFDLLLYKEEDSIEEDILKEYDIIGKIRIGRGTELDERVIDQVKMGMRLLRQIPGSQITEDLIEERIDDLFGTSKQEAERVYENIGFDISQTEGFLNEREKVVYFSLVKKVLDDTAIAINRLNENMKNLLRDTGDEQFARTRDKIEIEYVRIKKSSEDF